MSAQTIRMISAIVIAGSVHSRQQINLRQLLLEDLETEIDQASDRLFALCRTPHHPPGGGSSQYRSQRSAQLHRSQKKRPVNMMNRHSSATISTKSDCLMAMETHVHASEIVASNQKRLVAALWMRSGPCLTRALVLCLATYRRPPALRGLGVCYHRSAKHATSIAIIQSLVCSAA